MPVVSSNGTRYTTTENSPLITDDQYTQLLDAVTESTFRGSGMGSFRSSWEAVMSRYDRFGIRPVPANHEVKGLTFITRPKLNLTSTSLKQDRVLSCFDSNDSKNLMFAIRMYMDFKLSRSNLYAGIAHDCPWFADDSPFIVPLINSIRTLSGSPDFIIDSETTAGGFYGEDLSFARGSEMNMKAFDIELSFMDFQGGIVAAIFILWTRYIANVARGIQTAYPEDIISRRINYTCSIYRLILDPSMRVVTKWAKYTGCFPQSLPLGNFFNIASPTDHYIRASEEFSIPFRCNVFEAMDPIILQEFNMAVKDFCPNIDAATGGTLQRIPAPPSAEHNFAGIPYIDTGSGVNELMWLCQPEELENPAETVLRQILSGIKIPADDNTTVSAMASASTSQTASALAVDDGLV